MEAKIMHFYVVTTEACHKLEVLGKKRILNLK